MTEHERTYDALLAHCYPVGVRTDIQGSAVAELYRNGKVGKILLAGGELRGQIMGEVMREDLLQKGVSPEDIILIPEAVDTGREIDIFTKEAEINGWSNLLSVGNASHLKRIGMVYADKALSVSIISAEEVLREVSDLYSDFVDRFSRSLPEWIFRIREVIARNLYRSLGEEKLRAMSQNSLIKLVKSVLDR